MILYLDTSALVKLYTDETHSDFVRGAATITEDHGLRAYDGVHLAAAEAAYGMARGRADFRFAAFDAKLVGAAKRTGLPILAPE